VSITAADITIPTTLDLNAAPQCLPSLEETRKRRAQQARHQTSACPHCGEWAIIETVTVNRPGLPGVVQTLSRCQRNPRWQEERCPLTILSEEWAEETPAPVAEEEESMERTCEKCGVDIAHRGGRAKMCAPCAVAKKVERDREHNLRKSKRNVQDQPPQPQAIEPASPPQNVHHPVPAALRVSVLELAQRAVEGASIRATMRAILALSPERQDLLRRLLDDVEAEA
jgi:predicted RNA-binding Zn-ribbon protein involved in translation (DUF1610 family)